MGPGDKARKGSLSLCRISLLTLSPTEVCRDVGKGTRAIPVHQILVEQQKRMRKAQVVTDFSGSLSCLLALSHHQTHISLAIFSVSTVGWLPRLPQFYLLFVPVFRTKLRPNSDDSKIDVCPQCDHTKLFTESTGISNQK